MRFRREPLHTKLAREAGLDLGLDLDGGPAPSATAPWHESGVHGVARPREWDAVAVRDIAGLAGDQLEYVALPDGTLRTEEEVSEEALSALADALALDPPYRAQAVRRDGVTWAAAARRIEVAELPDAPSGAMHLELTAHEGERSLLVDGARVFGGVRSLESIAEARYSSYVAEAERLDRDLWELRVTPL